MWAVDTLLTAAQPGSERSRIAAVGPDSGRGPALTMLQFRHMGGALARKPAGSGARATLPGEVSMFAVGVIMDEASGAIVRDAVHDVETAVLPYRAGHYPNFVEEPADASAFFDAVTWRRLRRVKATYDPDDLFRGNHHIPPADRRKEHR